MILDDHFIKLQLGSIKMLTEEQREYIIKRAQKFIQLNYARGKFDEDEGKGVRDVIINNLVCFVIQDIQKALKGE